MNMRWFILKYDGAHAYGAMIEKHPTCMVFGGKMGVLQREVKIQGTTDCNEWVDLPIVREE